MPPEVEDLFLFVNPHSGGNKGADFLQVPQPFDTELDDGRIGRLHIYSLPDNADEGFRLFKELRHKAGKPLRMIVGGGDGTVMWADCAATANGIDTSRDCIFGIIPLGTGNDFSRVAGWGGKNPKRILSRECLKLHIMVQLWCKAKHRPHDVWEVCAEVDEDEGRILKVSKERKEVALKDNAKYFSLPMINYFSIGQESKVGIEFDKRRTKSQSCNLMVYACSGIFTECDCRTAQQIPDLIASLHAGLDADAPAIFEYKDEDEEDEDSEQEVRSLVGNPESLMFLNVNSYAGGAAHFWQLDTELAVEPALPDKDVNCKEDPGDGRIEVVTLPSIVNIALDRVHSDAKRVHSGGPYYLEFFHTDHDLDAYCEVDGEFYHLVNPVCVSVVFKKKLQVLQNDDPESVNILKSLLLSGKERAKDLGSDVASGVKGAVNEVRKRASSKE